MNKEKKQMAASSLINSPLEQFEIRDLINLEASVLGNVNLSLTNIGLYLIIGLIIGLLFTELSLNISKVVATKWSISQETLYATIHSMVVSQINSNKGQIYFPFI